MSNLFTLAISNDKQIENFIQNEVSENSNEFKSFKYTPNFKRPITIIDPETAEEVEPKLYFDNNTNEIKGKIKLKPYKSYVSFERRDKE